MHVGQYWAKLPDCEPMQRLEWRVDPNTPDLVQLMDERAGRKDSRHTVAIAQHAGPLCIVTSVYTEQQAKQLEVNGLNLYYHEVELHCKQCLDDPR